MLFKITLVLCAAAAISIALRRRSAAVRHLVWMSGLVLALILPLAAKFGPAVAMPEAVRFAVNAGGLAPSATPASYDWARWAWIAGAVLTALRFAFGHFQAARLVHRAKPAGVRDGIEVRIAPEGTLPFTWGIARATVVLPAGDVKESVWRHELAHALRRDHWWMLAAQAARSIFWFHPLVHWAARQAEIERERACDDFALAGGSEPASYAEALVEAARSSMELPSAAMAVAGRTPLESRIRAILDSGLDRRAVGREGAVWAVALCVAVALPLIAQEPKIHKVGEDGVTAPRVLEKVEPKYTGEARDAKIEGKVILDIEIHPDGRARNVTIKKALDAGLDVQAIRAVEQWKFVPGKKNGEAVAVRATVEVNFRLQ